MNPRGWAMAIGLIFLAAPGGAAVTPSPTQVSGPASAVLTQTPAVPSASPAKARVKILAHRPQVVVVIAPMAYEERELSAVTAALAERRARMIIASTQPGLAHGDYGGSATVEYTLERLPADAMDMIILIGGPGAKTYLWFHPVLADLLRTLSHARCPIGAIAISPGALAYAGVLRGRQASGLPTPDLKKIFMQSGASLSLSEVTRDGLIITASNSSAAPAFAQALANLLPRMSRVPAGKILPANPPAAAPTRVRVNLPGR